MTFTLKLENSRILKGIVETLASIIDETEFRVTPKEFTISAMDPSRICLLKLSIKKENFDEVPYPLFSLYCFCCWLLWL